jgi:hypothetical protein
LDCPRFSLTEREIGSNLFLFNFWWLNCPTQINGLTSLFKIIFYRCKRFNTNQSKEQVKVSRERSKKETEAALVWRTGLSGVPPDSVRCTRVLQLELLTFGFPRRSSAIIHRTCPVHTGLSGVPAEQRLSARNGRLCKVNSGNQMSEQTVRGAPDCPVSHRTVRCRIRTKPPTVDRFRALTGG